MSRKIYFLACMLSFCLMANPMYSQADFYENYFRDSVSFVFDGMDKIRQADIFTTHKVSLDLAYTTK